MNTITSTQDAELLKYAQKPIAVELTELEIRSMAASNYTPEEFNNYVLTKLQQCGAPIEGVLRKRPQHGKVFKVKEGELAPPGSFKYMWIDDASLEVMERLGGIGSPALRY